MVAGEEPEEARRRRRGDLGGLRPDRVARLPRRGQQVAVVLAVAAGRCGQEEPGAAAERQVRGLRRSCGAKPASSS
ncbi:MAG TPA: hypothetical protein VNJ70_15870 [Thermoanaerobaculia bacterium]|nr:hypothetical protein [Thermoanaerobaculia bacterium]